MKTFFAPISKINKKTREVEGILALEEKDKEGEIMDYESSKPFFEKWSQGIQKISGGKSVGNLRVMHQPIIGGKFTEIKFDDDKKRITVVSKISDDKSWNQILEGELNGYSILGDYKKRWKDTALKARRYTVDPFEGSLVDNPCMYGAEFTEIRENGETVVQKFNSKKDPQQFWLCRKECDLYHSSKQEAEECEGVVSKSLKEQEIDIDIDDEEIDNSKVTKSLYDISSLASNIQSLKWIETGSPDLKKKFGKALSGLFSVLTGMVKVEKEKFETTIDELIDSANIVKAVGINLINGENKMENDKEFNEEEFEKKITKKIVKATGIALKETIQEAISEALEEIQEDMQEIVKAVKVLGGTPKRGTVVTKSFDTKPSNKKNNNEDEDQSQEKNTKIEKISDRADPSLVKAMKIALAKPKILLNENNDENETNDNEGDDEDINEEK